MILNYENLSALSDEALCLEALSGSREAENILAERYLYIVRAAARPYFLAGGDAEDLIQEGMLGLLSAIREYKPERGSFAAFASRCVRNRMISGARAAGREKHSPLNRSLALDDPSTGVGDLHAPRERDPAELLLEQESYLETLQSFRAMLSPLENRVLGMYLEGLANAEIARELGRDTKSVENAIGRIRKKLSRRTGSRQ